MNFIELTLKSNNKISANVNLIESVDQINGETYIRGQFDGENYCPVKESYSEVMAKIHKAKRLEIASRFAVMIYECGAQRALEVAEELIKQNEAME